MADNNTAFVVVRGMTCQDCADHVTHALSGLGLTNVDVSWQDGRASFDWNPNVSDQELQSAVKNAGYQAGAISQVTQQNIGPQGISSSDAKDYDFLIIGSGSAAFSAAIKARELNYRVAMIEKSTIGGTCVNVGCIPSKALLEPAALAWHAGHQPFAGLDITVGTTALDKLIAQKDSLVLELRQHKYVDLIDVYGFTLIPGSAEFVNQNTVRVEGQEISAQKILIATGSSAWIPPIPGLKDAGYLTSTEALDVTEIPKSVAVIGGNSIGLELGQYFLHIGSKVTFVDIAERIAPFEEPEVSLEIGKILESEGASILTNATVEKITTTDFGHELYVSQNDFKTVIQAEKIIVATGRRANTESLNLVAAGIETDERGNIVVDAHLQTTNPNIYSAGDVTGGPQFVYVAAYEGALAANNALLGNSRTLDFGGLPKVTFTSPQIASAGMTEAQAISAGFQVVTSTLSLEAVPRALVNHDTAGLVKLVAESGTGRLLGASMVSQGAGDVIQSAVIAIRHRITAEEMAAMFHPYLTMAESLKLAAQTFTRDVTKLSCCAS